MKKVSKKQTSIQISDSQIYEELYNAIVEHKMSPGMKLTEDALGDIFHISRTRIRKILFRLEHHGIIVIEANRGAFVAKPTLKEAREVFEARRIIEIGLIQSICEPISATQIENIKKILKAEKQAIDKNLQGAAIRLSGEFHLEFARCANNNGVLIKYLEQLISKTSLIIAVFERTKSPACQEWDEHNNLLNAVVGGDTEKASSLMKIHLEQVERGLSLYESHETELSDVFQDIMGKYAMN